MIRDLKQVILEHIEKGALAVCFLIFLIVLILQLTAGREGFGKSVEEHIRKIEEIRSGVKVTERSVPDYTSEMRNYWVLADRERAQAYTTTPFVVLPGTLVGPQAQLKALAPEKVTAVAGVGRNVVVVSLPSQQAQLVERASFEDRVLFKLYRKKGDDEDYVLAHDEPQDALELYQRLNYLHGLLRYKLRAEKTLNPGDLELAVAIGLLTPQKAKEIKKLQVAAVQPARPRGRTRARVRRPRVRQPARRLTQDEREARARDREEAEEERMMEQAERRRREVREGRKPSIATVRVPTVAPVVVDLPTALSSPLPLEDTDVEHDMSYQYKVEVVLESPEKPTSAISLPSNLVKAIGDLEIYLRGGTELFATIEVRKWVAEVDSWISKSFSIETGEAIGSPVVMKLRDERGRLFVDAKGKFVEQEVNFSSGCTLVDLEKREKFDPEKDLSKSPTLRMAYLNPKGGLEYKWTERRKATGIAGSGARTQRRAAIRGR